MTTAERTISKEDALWGDLYGLLCRFPTVQYGLADMLEKDQTRLDELAAEIIRKSGAFADASPASVTPVAPQIVECDRSDVVYVGGGATYGVEPAPGITVNDPDFHAPSYDAGFHDGRLAASPASVTDREIAETLQGAMKRRSGIWPSDECAYVMARAVLALIRGDHGNPK